MDEEMEYAEMLEIPVSTVNVTKKRTRKPKKPTDLKEKVITKVNDGAEPDNTLVKNEAVEELPAAAAVAAETEIAPAVESPIQEDSILQESLPVSIPHRKKRPLLGRLLGRGDGEWNGSCDDTETPSAGKPENNSNEELPIYNYGLYNSRTSAAEDEREKRRSLLLGIEVAATVALCLGIFLTNIFLPGSAINTFFRSLGENKATDARTYSDFTLSSVLSEEADSLTLSPTGILSFQESGCVYPAVDGTVSEILQNADGTWTVKIAHSDSFSEVISGLSYLSCTSGSTVKSNVPLGYSDGSVEVQVSMYEDGALLNCFYLAEDGTLAWTEE